MDFRACDIRRLVGSQKQNGVGYLVNFPRPAHRNDAHAFGPHGRIGGATGCAHWRHEAGIIATSPLAVIVVATALVTYMSQTVSPRAVRTCSAARTDPKTAIR